MRRFRPTLVAGALALAALAGNASAQFTNTYIFGDSLSDAGQYGARFTTNPGSPPPCT
jgi:outer membrane lipase/esterase